MKALIWKELRENIGWALLALVALGGAEYFALHHTQYPGQMDVYFNDGITLCRKPFLMVTTFGCAVVGAALGFLQVLPELNRDRWAALLHRPVSRGQFFWGKAAAGVLLYLIGAGLPFLAMVWHVATPGNFGTPFVPGMALPGLADLATGLAYYFAALLVALQGGNIAWRVIPALAALHVSFVALEEELFRVVLVSALATSLTLCLAGWGAIHSRETLRRRPRLGQVAFFIAAFYGACGLGDIAVKLGAMAGYMGDRKYSSWSVLENGVPARIDYVNSVIASVTDIDGKPFSDPKFKPDRVGNSQLAMNTAGYYIGDSHGLKPWTSRWSYRESAGYTYATQPYSYPRFEQWFFLTRQRYYAGFLPAEKKEFARLGDDGFAPAGSTVRGFPERLESDQVDDDVLFLGAPDSLRLAHLPKQEIVKIELPAPGPIYGMSHAWTRTTGRSVEFQGLALGTGMVVLDGSGHQVAMLPYHRDVDRWGRLSMGVLKSMDRFVLRYEPSEWIDGDIKKTMPRYVEVMNAQGQVSASYEVPPPPPWVNPGSWSNYFAQRMASPAFFFGEMGYQRIGAAFGSTRLRDALHEQLVKNRKRTLKIGRIIVLVGLACSVITFFWARRAQLPPRRTWMWAASVLVLGVPGLMVFWVAGERPRTVPCPACQRSRRIDRDSCSQCGSAWPAHATDDTAIIDRTPASPLAV